MTNALMVGLRWLDKNAERAMILVAYSSMALIIIYGVFERFVFRTQIPWSSSIPIYLFLWVTWIGCSQNVRKRTHLVFNDIRIRMSYGKQFACLIADALLWWGFGAVVIYFTVEQTLLVEMNFAIVQGTDNLMQWWFYLATPVAWTMLMIRVLQNLIDDVKRFQAGKPFLVEIQAIGQE